MSSADGAIYGAAILIYVIFWLVMMAVSIAMYVMHSLGMYTIAKRRGIANPFLAWIPIANVWILGSIADQYDEAVKGVKKKSRVLLLVLEIAMCISAAVVFVVAIVFEVIAIGAFAGSYENAYVVTGGTAALIIILLLLFAAVMVLAIVSMVFTYIAYYKLFKSCRPDLAVLFLVLSILISFAMPICVFICRNDDKGLPANSYD